MKIFIAGHNLKKWNSHTFQQKAHVLSVLGLVYSKIYPTQNITENCSKWSIHRHVALVIKERLSLFT